MILKKLVMVMVVVMVMMVMVMMNAMVVVVVMMIAMVMVMMVVVVVVVVVMLEYKAKVNGCDVRLASWLCMALRMSCIDGSSLNQLANTWLASCGAVARVVFVTHHTDLRAPPPRN